MSSEDSVFFVKPRRLLDDAEVTGVIYSNTGEPFHGLEVPEVGLSAKITRKGTEADLLSSTSDSRLVSLRAWSVMTEFRIPEGVFATGVEIRGLSNEYLVVYALRSLDLINLDHADAMVVQGQIAWVDKWVLDKEKLPECDLLIERGTAWFVTKALRDALESSGLVGFEFEEVDVL